MFAMPGDEARHIYICAVCSSLTETPRDKIYNLLKPGLCTCSKWCNDQWKNLNNADRSAILKRGHI